MQETMQRAYICHRKIILETIYESVKKIVTGTCRNNVINIQQQEDQTSISNPINKHGVI